MNFVVTMPGLSALSTPPSHPTIQPPLVKPGKSNFQKGFRAQAFIQSDVRIHSEICLLLTGVQSSSFLSQWYRMMQAATLSSSALPRVARQVAGSCTLTCPGFSRPMGSSFPLAGKIPAMDLSLTLAGQRPEPPALLGDTSLNSTCDKPRRFKACRVLPPSLADVCQPYALCRPVMAEPIDVHVCSPGLAN